MCSYDCTCLGAAVVVAHAPGRRTDLTFLCQSPSRITGGIQAMLCVTPTTRPGHEYQNKAAVLPSLSLLQTHKASVFTAPEGGTGERGKKLEGHRTAAGLTQHASQSKGRLHAHSRPSSHLTLTLTLIKVGCEQALWTPDTSVQAPPVDITLASHPAKVSAQRGSPTTGPSLPSRCRSNAGGVPPPPSDCGVNCDVAPYRR